MSGKRVKLIGIICSAFLIILLFQYCTSKQESNVEVIKYLARATPEQLDIWEKVIKEFMKQNPDIKVIIENVAYQGYWEKLLTMIASGDPPDLVFMESRRLPDYISKNALIPLDTLVKNDTEIKLNDFYSVAIQSYKFNNQLFGLPNDVAVVVMFYNKDLFDQEGISYPKDGWTWNDMVMIGKKLTRDKNGDGIIDQYGISTYAWKCAIWQNGGDLVDNPERPRKSTMNSIRAKQGLQFCADLVHKYKIAPPSAWWQSQQGYEMFSSQVVGMSIEGHWMVPVFKNLKFRWDVVTLPKGRVRAGENYGSCFSIPTGSKHIEATWRLIKFLAGEQGQKLIVSSGFSTPALKSIAQSSIFLSGQPENARAFLKMLEVGHSSMKAPDVLKIENIYWQEMDQFWLGKVSVDEATKKIDEQVNQVLKEGVL